MKIINIKLELFTYNELNKEAKEKAFNEHFDFLIGFASEEQKIVHLTEKQQKKYIEESININEYLFFNNGNLASCTTYTEEHPKKEITEFKFLNKVYEVL